VSKRTELSWNMSVQFSSVHLCGMVKLAVQFISFQLISQSLLSEFISVALHVPDERGLVVV